MGMFDFLKGKNKNIYNDNGLNEVYFKNGRGKIKERFFKKNGELDGLHETFGEYGSCLLTKTNYKNGKKHGRYELHQYKVSLDINKADLNETFLFCVINYYEGVLKDQETYSPNGWIRTKIFENGNQLWYSSKDTLCTFEEIFSRLSNSKLEIKSNSIYKINDFVFEDIIKTNCTRPYSGIFEEKKYTDGKYCETVGPFEKEKKEPIEFNGGLLLDISLKKLEKAIEESGSDIYFDSGSKLVELGSDIDTAISFFSDITDEKLAIYAEYDAEDDEGNDIALVRLCFLNYECPDNLKKYYNGNLKKYYNGFLLIIHGKLIEINSSAYNNIDIDEAWEYSEIRNSGVQAAKASSDFHLNFTY